MEASDKRIWWIVAIAVAIVLIALYIWWPRAANAQTKDCYADEQMPYTQIEGSGLFSLFMLPGMLAIGGAGAAGTPEWRCTTKIAIQDAAGAALKVRKIRDRGQVEPY